MLNDAIKRLQSEFNNHRLEFICIFLIALFALALRLYKIDQYLTFLGDEGRDVRVVRNILQGDLAFIGPQTSIGNMYLGPLYYYMMAPFLWLWNLNPVGPAVMIALLSAVTVVFVWWVGRTWFSPKAGLIAALIYSLMPVSIIYGRTSWNPNPMPFFALLSVWGIWQVWRYRHFRWLPIVGLALTFALQMHYLALLLVPTLGLFWLITILSIRQDKSLLRQALIQSFYAILIFLILMSPLLLFDLKHDWSNYNAFKAFFTDRQTTINLNPARSDRFLLVLYKIIDDLVMGSSHLYLGISSILLIVSSLFFFVRTSKDKAAYLLLLVWVGFGYLGLVVYKQHVYAHYFGFLFPAFSLLLGYIIWRLSMLGPVFKAVAAASFAFLLAIYFNFAPFYPPNNQLKRTEQAVDQIIAKSNGDEFNFALIAKQNYDESYRYFFENKNAQMFRGEDKVTKQLFVICEDGDKCAPEGHDSYQVAIFGIAHITDEWRLDHLRLYRLVHTQK